MRRTLLVAGFLLASAPAFAVTARYWSEEQSATRTTPSGVPTSYLNAFPLSDVTGFRVTAKATSGAITKACTLRAWVYSSVLGVWSRAARDGTGLGYTDLSITAEDIGATAINFPDQQVHAPVGWVIYATDDCDALTIAIHGVTK